MELIYEIYGKNNPVKKAKFTLSHNYYDRFLTDIFTFNVNKSTLIAAIIHAYCEDSNKLSKFRSNGVESPQNLLTEDFRFRKNLLKLINHFNGERYKKTRRRFSNTSTKTIQWTISDKTYYELKRDALSYNQPMTFVRDLIEEYLELPFDKRESVVLYKQLDDVNHAISNNLAFKYTYQSGVSCIMHPYKIVVDPDLHYTYIVGHRVRTEEYDPDKFVPSAENIGTIRLLNMLYDSPKGDNFNIFGQRKINETVLEERLKNSSVAFLSSESFEITVLFDPIGERMFRSIIHNRPYLVKYTEKYENGFRRYTLRCTLFQASVYFCSFENHARIIDPPMAIEAITKRLKDSYAMYL